MTQRPHGPYLYGDHRQDLHGDSIELIEAAPGSSLGQALVDIATGLERVRWEKHAWRALPGAPTCPISPLAEGQAGELWGPQKARGRTFTPWEG